MYLYILYFLTFPSYYEVYNMNTKYEYTIPLVRNETHYPINPSILYYNNTLYGSVRYTNDHKCLKKTKKTYTSEVHIINAYWDTVEIIDVGRLKWCYHQTFKRRGAEDPRLFFWNNKMYSLITVVGYTPTPCNNKIMLYNYTSKEVTRIYTPFNNNQYMEKNWLPFIYNDELYIEYFVNPRKIFRYSNVITNDNRVDITYCSNLYPNLHGSVNPVKINDAFYLGMAHNSLYNHIFYIFENKLPFKIHKFSIPFNLHNNYTNQFEFITGMSIITVDDVKYILLSYSINDCINKISYINLNFVINNLLTNSC